MKRAARSACLLGAFALLSSCTEDAYVIGAVCPALPSCGGSSAGGAVSGSSAGGSAGAGGSGATGGAAGGAPTPGLVLDFTGSGVERLPQQLLGVDASNLLIGTDATASAWPARIGGDFRALAGASLVPGEPWPFADAGSALEHDSAEALASSEAWSGATDGALAIEAVFRAQPSAVLLSQVDASNGLELSIDATGRLSLRLLSAGQELRVSSTDLVPDAWHHCLAFIDTSQATAQLVCNGQPGDPVSIPNGFAITAAQGDAKLGGATAARTHWAELGRFQGSSFGPSGAWADAARERFARMVGTYATGAGAPLPYSEVRKNGAYIDMSPSDDPALRRLHPVGQDWPRIVCRPTSAEARLCGLLVEASSSRPLAASASQLDSWTASEAAVTVGSSVGPTGDDTLAAIAPSLTSQPHTLDLDVNVGNGPAVVSLYGRAAAHHLLRVEVVGVAAAVFDLAAPSVVDPGTSIVASAEPWGNGLTRVSYSFDIAQGQHDIRITLLDDSGADTFAGDGQAALDLGNFELRFRSYSTPLPLLGGIQSADRLVYPAGNGNLPMTPRVRLSTHVWLPGAKLLADSAIINVNFATHYDQQMNLFVASQDGTVRFWGIQGQATIWQNRYAVPVTDGLVHTIKAEMGAGTASLDVDGTNQIRAAASFDTSTLDRIELGASVSASGPLTGILRNVRIEPAP